MPANSVRTADSVRRLVRHPAVWPVPVTALLVLVAEGFNIDFYYTFFVNYDPQGEVQQAEATFTSLVFTYTSGVLAGQVLCVLVGIGFARRYRHSRALQAAAAVSVVLAGVTVAVSTPLVDPVSGMAASMAFDYTAPRRVLLTELAAYPAYAAIGVALGVLLWRLPTAWRRLLFVLLAAGWFVATVAGLYQDNRFAAPPWLLGIPPVAAATAVALAALSGNDYPFDPNDPYAVVVVGDWGRGAGAALLAGALVWAVVLNVVALFGRPVGDRFRGRRTRILPVQPSRAPLRREY